MLEFKSKITKGGRIVIPAECRKRLQVDVGDEVVIRLQDDEELRLYGMNQAVKRAQALVQKHNEKKISLTQLLF